MKIAGKIYSKARVKAIHQLRDWAYIFGLNHKIYSKATGCRILTYHGICKRGHLRFNTIFLKERMFEAHLKFYKKYFNVISLDDFYQQRFSKGKFNVCLTFDDGFANNYKYVLPLLEQYKMPATFFVTAIRKAGHDILWNDFISIFSTVGPKILSYKNTEYVKNPLNKYINKTNGSGLVETLRTVGFDDKAQLMEDVYPQAHFKQTVDVDYWLQMTPGQIKELSVSPFVTIGAHGYYHNDLARINIEDAVEEMRISKQYLEDITGKTITSFAFPYGTYKPQLINRAADVGYKKLLALEFLYPDDHANPLMQERLTINPFISVPNQMHAIIKGRYDG